MTTNLKLVLSCSGKYILPALASAIFVLGCQSSEGQVPEAVKTAFKQKYPGEDDPDWEKDKNGNFESSFKIDGKKYRADFSPEGQWVETERSIKKKDLPKPIEEKLETEDFEDYDIVEIEEVQHPTKGLFYDVELKKDGEKHDVEFKKDGAIIN